MFSHSVKKQPEIGVRGMRGRRGPEGDSDICKLNVK